MVQCGDVVAFGPSEYLIIKVFGVPHTLHSIIIVIIWIPNP